MTVRCWIESRRGRLSYRISGDLFVRHKQTSHCHIWIKIVFSKIDQLYIYCILQPVFFIGIAIILLSVSFSAGKYIHRCATGHFYCAEFVMPGPGGRWRCVCEMLWKCHKHDSKSQRNGKSRNVDDPIVICLLAVRYLVERHHFSRSFFSVKNLQNF